jgi:hypothetical protein
MSRPLADIDADLARWSDTAARIGRSIETLTQSPSYLRLKAQSRLGTLTGISKSRSAAAVSATDQLWRLYLTLDKTLSEAVELRRSKNPFGADERHGKIDALLTGPAIELPGDQTAFAQMTISGAPDRRLSLADVFRAMDTAFNEARDIVAAAERGWQNEAAFDAFRATAHRLTAEAATLGFGTPTAIDQAFGAMDAAAISCENDPLGCDAATRQIDDLLKTADLALAAARQDRAAADTFLRDAQARLEALGDLTTRVARARDDRLAQIADPQPAAATPTDPAPELRVWLAKLTQTAKQGRTRATLVGAQSWLAQIARAEAALQACFEADKLMLDTRLDLRGRFSAIKAKADGLKAQNRLTADGADLIARTAEVLFGRATPLPEAVQLMRRCDRL